ETPVNASTIQMTVPVAVPSAQTSPALRRSEDRRIVRIVSGPGVTARAAAAPVMVRISGPVTALLRRNRTVAGGSSILTAETDREKQWIANDHQARPNDVDAIIG